MEERVDLAGNTRGRILQLLRRSKSTVAELADALQLTSNAVRAHLGFMEEKGWIERHGVRRGIRKPSQIYGLTEEGALQLSKAYAPTLQALLTVLRSRLDPAQIEEIMQAAGEYLASSAPPMSGCIRERTALAIGLLEQLGAMAEIQDDGDEITISGFGCPLAAVTTDHPEICTMVQTLLARLIGAPVRERCERKPSAQCRFVVSRVAG